ncbi:unnamed protein product [Camellia sinensis]
MIFALMTVIFFASRPIFIFTKFYCTAAAHHHRQSTATIEEEDQQRAKTQFSIDSKHLLQLDSQLLCLCALIQYFSPFFCLCALIQPHHRCTAVQSTRPPAFSPLLPLSIDCCSQGRGRSPPDEFRFSFGTKI